MLTLQELIFGLIIMLPFMLIPTFIGFWRGHPNKPALIAVNILLLPFFGIGWVLALIWAITVPGDSTKPH